MANKKYISAKEAGKLTGQSISWIHKMTNRGFIDCYGFNGECLFSIDDIEKAIKRGNCRKVDKVFQQLTPGAK